MIKMQVGLEEAMTSHTIKVTIEEKIWLIIKDAITLLHLVINLSMIVIQYFLLILYHIPIAIYKTSSPK